MFSCDLQTDVANREHFMRVGEMLLGVRGGDWAAAVSAKLFRSIACICGCVSKDGGIWGRQLMTISFCSNELKDLQFANNWAGRFKLRAVILPSRDWSIPPAVMAHL